MLPDFIESFSSFLEITKYLSPIPWDANVVRAYSRRKLALDLEYGNEYTLGIMQTLKSLLADEISGDIDSWAEKKAYNIRQPIEEQYNDTELELKGLLEEKYGYRQRKFIQFLKTNTLAFSVFMVLFSILHFTLSKIFPNFSRIYSLNIDDPGYVLFVFIPLSLFATYVFNKFFKRIKSGDQEIEESRYNRKINIVEDKLKRLEILKKADLDKLIKSREWEM